MSKRIPPNQEERLRSAERLVKLSNDRLSINQQPKTYISLDIGGRPNKNAISVRKDIDRISAYIRSASLVDELTIAGFKPELGGRPKDERRYRLSRVSIDVLDQHQPLFSRIVEESIDVIQSKKPQKVRK